MKLSKLALNYNSKERTSYKVALYLFNWRKARKNNKVPSPATTAVVIHRVFCWRARRSAPVTRRSERRSIRCCVNCGKAVFPIKANAPSKCRDGYFLSYLESKTIKLKKLSSLIELYCNLFSFLE